MGNVNSEDPGPGGTVDTTSDGMGGAERVVQSREEVTGRGVWPVLGSVVVACLLLVPVVWIVVQVTRMAGYGDGELVWLYASLGVLILAVLVWSLFRLINGRGQ